ncbi:hypothetical protein CLV49_3052 [Labedella gwakjiensis]|uniref:Uncharacterized protein n=1 Tax=Labedella gwakjiensis TaxID=390269 RepID=A0A2P8GZL4_9MICO|nr:hypothetical protein CLV49_3052 [Labedella gwakjiensis]
MRQLTAHRGCGRVPRSSCSTAIVVASSRCASSSGWSSSEVIRYRGSSTSASIVTDTRPSSSTSAGTSCRRSWHPGHACPEARSSPFWHRCSLPSWLSMTGASSTAASRRRASRSAATVGPCFWAVIARRTCEDLATDGNASVGPPMTHGRSPTSWKTSEPRSLTYRRVVASGPPQPRSGTARRVPFRRRSDRRRRSASSRSPSPRRSCSFGRPRVRTVRRPNR